MWVNGFRKLCAGIYSICPKNTWLDIHLHCRFLLCSACTPGNSPPARSVLTRPTHQNLSCSFQIKRSPARTAQRSGTSEFNWPGEGAFKPITFGGRQACSKAVPKRLTSRNRPLERSSTQIAQSGCKNTKYTEIELYQVHKTNFGLLHRLLMIDRPLGAYFASYGVIA